jgi:hypothetical protein
MKLSTNLTEKRTKEGKKGVIVRNLKVKVDLDILNCKKKWTRLWKIPKTLKNYLKKLTMTKMSWTSLSVKKRRITAKSLRISSVRRKEVCRTQKEMALKKR